MSVVLELLPGADLRHRCMMGTGLFHHGNLGLRRLHSEARVRRGLTARAALLLFPVLPFCISGGAFAAEQWLKVQSSHFELLTPAGERKGQEAILYFETVRSFFLKAASSTGNSQVPVCIVAFNSEKQYHPYRMNEVAKAHYLSGRDRDYIVMSSMSSEQYPVAIHEYTHLLLRHSGFKLPLWLNEGLAELYSTLKPFAGKVQVGALQTGHDQLLQQKNKWLDLETLVAVDHDSPLYNERNRVNLFYAQSWALTHMLSLSPAYRNSYSEFLKRLTSGATPAAAFQETYGKSLAAVGKDLGNYMRGNRFDALLIDVKLDKAAEQPDVRPASDLETGMALANLLTAAKKRDDAKRRYADLATKYPKNPDVQEALGYLALLGPGKEEVRPYFARAAELGSTHAQFYLDYVGLLSQSGERPSALIPLLQKAVQLNPDFKQAHYLLGIYLIQEQKFEQALAHMAKVKNVDREQAAPFFRAAAYANYRLGKLEEARKDARLAREYARTPEEISSTDELLNFVSRDPSAAAGQGPPAPEIATPDPSPEDLSPRPAKEPGGATDPPARPAPVREAARQSTWGRIDGTLHQFDCLGKIARLRILSAGKQVALAIMDPVSVTIKPDGRTIDFSCGPQKPTPVTLEYMMKTDPDLGTVGVLKTIEFR